MPLHVRDRLIADCASDPPLSVTQRGLGVARADDVIYGLGAVALARGHKRMAVAVPVGDEAARAALAQAIRAVGADVEIVDVPDAWPAVAAGERDESLPASMLVAVARAARESAASSPSSPSSSSSWAGEELYVTVAGAVAEPRLLACAPSLTMAGLVAHGGGALEDDWVAVAGGAPAGRLVAREATLAEAGAPATVLILSARHPWVRRLRTTVSDWLWRAASACEGCRVCSDACPVALEPHALTATLATGRDDGTAPAAFVACTGCGVCDAACPASLSPRALAGDVRARLIAAGAEADVPQTTRVGIDRALLTLRLGLGAYDRSVSR